MLAKLDRPALGEILTALREADRLKHTIVIATGDHGEALGEEGRLGHGPILVEPVLHVPLIIRDFRGTQVQRVRERVGLLDIAPTLLELAGLPAIPGAQGRSLAGTISGEKLEEAVYFAEVRLTKQPYPDWYDPDALAVYHENFKATLLKGSLTLFDLDADPRGIVPVKPGMHPDARQILETSAADFLASKKAPEQTDLTESDIRALRALGYVQ